MENEPLISRLERIFKILERTLYTSKVGLVGEGHEILEGALKDPLWAGLGFRRRTDEEMTAVFRQLRGLPVKESVAKPTPEEGSVEELLAALGDPDDISQ